MNHLRKEKNCLNCGAEVPGRYCSNCGQENLVPKETTAHLIQHFISDLTHYDSQFLVTLKYLLFKPGFLTLEYLKGRRIRYLNPVRMYFFISFLFFIILFAKRSREVNEAGHHPIVQNLNGARQMLADSLKSSLRGKEPVSYRRKLRDSIIREIAISLDTPVIQVKKDESIGFFLSERGFKFTLVETLYSSIPEYDSVQKTLPEKDRDRFIGRLFVKKLIDIKKRLGSNSQITVTEEFQHNVPKLMFILLPVFALLIKLFYMRNKNKYAADIIFSINYHSFAFLLLLVMYVVNLMLPFTIVNLIIFFMSLFLLLFYLIIALRKVYGQNYFVSTLKALSISILYFILLIGSLGVWAIVIYFMS